MKKLFLLIIIGYSATLLLQSCSRLGNISITKRHYSNGYYVDLGSRKQDVPVPRVSDTKAPVIIPSALKYVGDERLRSPERKLQAPPAVVLGRHAENKKTITKHVTGKMYASTGKINVVTKEMQTASLESYVRSVPDANAAHPSSSSSSAPMWVIILFAIIIPPVGVALKFGFIDKFWISLLLTIIFWLPGAIYSVIVVTE